MKKFLTFLFAVAAVFLMNISFFTTAEAARVAIVPLQTDEKEVKRSSDFSSYYWDMMVERFKYPDYELMDDEKVADLIPDKGLDSFDEATLKAVLEKADAEIIVAMRIDKVYDEAKNRLTEPHLLCHMKGEYAAYNRLTGKYYQKKINYNEMIEEVLTIKTDWQQEAFASTLRRCLNRTLEDNRKKKK